MMILFIPFPTSGGAELALGEQRDDDIVQWSHQIMDRNLAAMSNMLAFSRFQSTV
jgi:hypothetical protein